MSRRDFFRTTQKKQYALGKRRNPYFKSKKNRINKSYLIFGLSVFILLSCIFILLNSYFFNISKVHISGIQSIEKKEMETVITNYLNESRLFVLKNKILFFFSEKTLTNELMEAFALSESTIERTGSELVITLKERTANLIWSTAGEDYIVDLNGVVVKKIPSENINSNEFNLLPIFIDRNNITVSIGKNVLESDEISNAFLFYDTLEKSGIIVEGIEVDRITGKWMKVNTNQNFFVLFDALADINQQIQNLNTVILSTPDLGRNLEYIDLRFGDHVYYK